MKKIIILIIGLIIGTALIETITVKSFGSTESPLSLFSIKTFAWFLLINLAVFLILGGFWFLAAKLLNRPDFQKRVSAVSLKSKLVAVFAFVALIPIVILVFISHLIIAQSINRWELVANELKKLRVLPMVENAEGVATDFNLIQALEEKANLSGLDFSLPEGYIVAIYDMSGKMIFNTNDDPALHEKLITLGGIGLPPVKEFQPGEPILPQGSVKLRSKEFVLSSMMCQSSKDGKPLGIVVVGKIVPSTLTDIGSVRKTIAAVFALTAIFIFFISLWISSLIAREITDPIQRLVVGTREVAGGNLDYQVDITARDEVGVLAESFNLMTMNLRHNAEELKRAEKAAAWREVAQKLAHEIKNPLTPIQLSAERLQRRYHSRREGYEEILDECTNTIIEEVERLRRLLDEFSQFARMPIINPVPSNINNIVHEAIKLYEKPENMEIKTEYNENLPQILVDPDQMKRAFFNIIKNAMEAMKDGGNLTVITRLSSNKCIEVEFADTGPGISADMMEKLFTPHFSTKTGGAGLGLAIVKKIATDHGGDVSIKSEAGKGAAFVISIPVSEGVSNE